MTLTNVVKTKSRRANRGLRLDVQALRAIAVLLVVADHMGVLQRLPGRLNGGFIGVDVFFVISGFLITGHLLKEVMQHGRLSFRSFYGRRARRILPAAILVLLVSTIAAFVVFWPERAWSSAKDALWALLFASNINFASTGTDYFSAGQTSIFQHYWSLSVEEQFYLMWPVFVLAAVWVAKRRHAAVVPTIATIVIAAGVGSFVFACVFTASAPAATYFSTLGRVFEFCSGALIAVLAKDLQGIGKAPIVRKVGSVLGLALIVVSVIVIDPNTAFPGPWAALPAIGAAIFIAAGTGVEGGVRLPALSSPPVIYVGSLSYSIYLWHWPVIVISGALMPQSVTLLVVVLLSTSILSVISYHFVERRFLRPALIDHQPEAKGTVRSQAPGVLKPISIMLGGIVVVVAITSAAALTNRSSAPLTHTGDVLHVQEQTLRSRQLLTDVQTRISGAAKVDTWEGLSPAVGVAPTGESGVLTENCWNGRDETDDHCIIGDPSAPNTLAILGDSIAMNWTEALWQVVKDRPSWNLAVYAKVGCPYADVTVYDTDGSPYENCNEFRRGAVNEIRRSQPEILILASALKKTLPGASNTSQLGQMWKSGAEEVANDLAGIDRIVAIAPPPEGKDLSSCANRFSSPSNCSSQVTGTWLTVVGATKEVFASKGRTFIDTGLWFCEPSGLCPATISQHQVRTDSVHLTQEYALSLVPLIESWLFSESKSSTSN